MSGRRTSSAVFGGWRQIRLRSVRVRLMADDSGLDAGTNRPESKYCSTNTGVLCRAVQEFPSGFKFLFDERYIPDSMFFQHWHGKRELPDCVDLQETGPGSVLFHDEFHSEQRGAIFSSTFWKIRSQPSYLTLQPKEEADRCHKLFKQIKIDCRWLIHPSESHRTHAPMKASQK